MKLTQKTLELAGVNSLSDVKKDVELKAKSKEPQFNDFEPTANYRVTDVYDLVVGANKSVKSMGIPGLESIITKLRDFFRNRLPKRSETQVMSFDVRNSSMVESVAYSPKIKTLTVKFVKGGVTYIYFDVPVSVFNGMKDADSKGKYFWTYIRGRSGNPVYKYERAKD